MSIPVSNSGSTLSQCQLMSDVKNENQYGVFFDKNYVGWAIRRNIATNTIFKFRLQNISGNPFNFPILDPTDNSYSISCGIDADNILHVCANQKENSPPSSAAYQNYAICTDPLNLTVASKWVFKGSPEPFAADKTGSSGGYCLNIFDRLKDETLVWFLSQSDSVATTIGRDWLAMKRTGGVWTPLLGPGKDEFVSTTSTGLLTDIHGNLINNDGTPNNVVICGFQSEYNQIFKIEILHIWGMWLFADKDTNFQKEPFYLRSFDSGKTWKSITGVTQPMPLTYANKVASATISSASLVCCDYVIGLCVDNSSSPSMIIRAGSTTDPVSYNRLYWDGSAWQAQAAISTSPLSLFMQNGYMMKRDQADSGLRRIRLTNTNVPASTFYIGPEQLGFYPNHDPVRLRKRGVYSILIPSGLDGDTPQVWEYSTF